MDCSLLLQYLDELTFNIPIPLFPEIQVHVDICTQFWRNVIKTTKDFIFIKSWLLWKRNEERKSHTGKGSTPHQGERLKEVRWGTNYKYAQELWKQVFKKQCKTQSLTSRLFDLYMKVSIQQGWPALHNGCSFPYTSTLLLHQEFQREHVSSQTQPPFQLQWSVWTKSCPHWGLPEALNSCGKLVMLG